MGRRLLWLATLAFVAHRALVPLAETDLFFHLKIGELLLDGAAIPSTNLFSFTHPEARELDLSWAFQVLVALLYRAGGWGAIVIAKALLIAVAAALVWRTCRVEGAGALASSAAVVLATLAAEPRFVERPHLVTLVGITALNLLLATGRAPLWLPLGVLAWANFHAGVFFAPLLLVLNGTGAIFDGRAPTRRYWLVTLGCLAAIFATPAGALLAKYLLWHTGLGTTRIVEEFRLANPYDDNWMFLLAFACAMSAFVVRSWRRLLPAIVVFALACRSVRFAAEWALLVAPIAASGLSALPRLRRLELAAAAALFVLIATERREQPPPLALADDVVPFEAIAFVNDHGLRDRLYVDLDLGCYLLWEGWPRWRVFQDARLPAYPDEFHRALDETPLQPAAFDALLRKYGVDAALLNYPDINMRAGCFDPDEWALVFKRADALVLTRRLPSRAALIAAHEIPLRARFAFEGGTRFEPLWDAPPHVEKCEWDLRLFRALADDPVRQVEALRRAREHGCAMPRYSSAGYRPNG